MGSMETCEYRYQNFRDILDQVQKLVDDLNLRSYSNLSAWVAELDKQVCVCVHSLRLYHVVASYTKQLKCAITMSNWLLGREEGGGTAQNELSATP